MIIPEINSAKLFAIHKASSCNTQIDYLAKEVHNNTDLYECVTWHASQNVTSTICWNEFTYSSGRKLMKTKRAALFFF